MKYPVKEMKKQAINHENIFKLHNNKGLTARTCFETLKNKHQKEKNQSNYNMAKGEVKHSTEEDRPTPVL